MGEVSRRLNLEGVTIDKAPVKPDVLAWLVRRIHDGTVSNNSAKVAFDHLWKSAAVSTSYGEQVDGVIESLGLKQTDDTQALETMIDCVITAHPKNVAQYRAGNAKALNALVGQIMKDSQGKANPQQVNEMLRQKLVRNVDEITVNLFSPKGSNDHS
jgi:aspartyl-tRNA(Asn)/glutamyl-tRNA(Gln) amidotransferase subunit B